MKERGKGGALVIIPASQSETPSASPERGQEGYISSSADTDHDKG